MARHRFGGVADYVIAVGVDNAATLQPGTVVTCWSMTTGGVQYTDLTDVDGLTPIADGLLTVDSAGALPEFFGPDGVRSVYLDGNSGSGPRRRTVATDVGEDLTTAEATLDTLAADSLSKDAVTMKGDLIAATAAGEVARVGAGTAGQMLVADPLPSVGMRWGSAWRRRDLPDPLLADKTSDEAPTISVAGPSSASTIPSAQPLLAPDTGPFRYLGAGSFQFGAVFPGTTLYLPTSRYPNTYSSGQSNWAVEFGTDASVFEVLFKYISSATKYRLSVDGRKVTDLAVVTGAATVGNRHVLKIDFGTAKPRRIRLDLTTFPFGGIFLGPGATAWKTTSRGGRLAVLGDSISDGSSENTGAGIGTWTYRAGRLLGCTDVWDQSRGGTGYITTGSFATLGNRVASDIEPYGFDRIIVWAGYNDNLGDQGAIDTAADSLYAALKDAVAPGGDIYVIGCWSPSGTPAGSVTSTDNTLAASAEAAGLPFISPLSGEVIDGSGTIVDAQGPWITTATAAGYVGGDGVHPTDAGHTYLSRRIVEALKALMPA